MSAGTVTPAAVRSLTYTGAAEQTAVAEILAYPAGLGAQATADLLAAAQKCPKISVTTKDMGFATQSFTIENTANPPTAREVVFRAGDVVGIVAVKGGDLNTTPAWSKSWYATWAPVLTTVVCPDQASSLADASRSPSSPEYVGGWQHREVITLDEARQIAADTAGRILVHGGADSSTGVTKVPDAPLTDAGVPATLPTGYPSDVDVTLPADRPARPAVPQFPLMPTSIASAVSVVPDLVGPGCGWKFTGEKEPAFDNTAAATAAQQSRQAAVKTLVKARAHWWMARYQYAVAYNQYAADVKKWNDWESAASAAIATAWWASYDKAELAYQEQAVAWTVQYAQWQAANAASGCTTDCPTPPAKPVEPVKPTLPRP